MGSTRPSCWTVAVSRYCLGQTDRKLAQARPQIGPMSARSRPRTGRIRRQTISQCKATRGQATFRTLPPLPHPTPPRQAQHQPSGLQNVGRTSVEHKPQVGRKNSSLGRKSAGSRPIGFPMWTQRRSQKRPNIGPMSSEEWAKISRTPARSQPNVNALACVVIQSG